jgi:hypothetical protein
LDELTVPEREEPGWVPFVTNSRVEETLLVAKECFWTSATPPFTLNFYAFCLADKD